MKHIILALVAAVTIAMVSGCCSSCSDCSFGTPAKAAK